MRIFLDYRGRPENKAKKDIALTSKRGYLKTAGELTGSQTLQLEATTRDARSISARECWQS